MIFGCNNKLMAVQISMDCIVLSEFWQYDTIHWYLHLKWFPSVCRIIVIFNIFLLINKYITNRFCIIPIRRTDTCTFICFIIIYHSHFCMIQSIHISTVAYTSKFIHWVVDLYYYYNSPLLLLCCNVVMFTMSVIICVPIGWKHTFLFIY